jgi:hypothetical protein
MDFTHTKNVYVGSFIKARIRIKIRIPVLDVQIRIRPKRSGSEQIWILICNTV